MIIPLRNPHYGSSWVEAHSVYFSLSLSRKRARWIDNETEIFFSRSNPREKWITRLKYTGNIIVTTAAHPRLCSSLCTRLSPSLSSCTVFFFSLRNNGTIDIDIASRMRLRILGWNGTANDVPNNECETKRENWAHFEMRARVRNRILSSLSFPGIDRLRRAIRFRISSNFVRIVGKYKGKRNGRGMAIELTRPSLAHTHIHRDILTRFPWHTNHVAVKEKERDKERGSEIVGPRRVTFKSTSADVGFLPVPRYPARLSARQFNEMFERHAKQ